MVSTEHLLKFMEMIKYHTENLDLLLEPGLTRKGHTFRSEGTAHELNLMRHSGNHVIFESVPYSDPQVFDDSLRFEEDGHVTYSIAYTTGPNTSRNVSRWSFYLCSTEEELFQASTIHDMKELTLPILQELRKIYDDFQELCNSVPPAPYKD